MFPPLDIQGQLLLSSGTANLSALGSSGDTAAEQLRLELLAQGAAGERSRILVVDDNHYSLEAITTMLD